VTRDKTSDRQGRREPTFDAPRGHHRGDEDDFRVSAEDRSGSRTNRKKPGSQQEPRQRGKTRRRRKGSFLGRMFYWSMVMGLWVVIGLGGFIAYHASQLPPINQLTVPKRPPNIAILASDGSLLANRGETGGRTITIKEVPPYLPRAFVAIEDRRFYSHWGIDPVGIGRAMVRNLSGRGVMQGGSTLTQQLAKNLFLTPDRTASRKIQEAILALWLEQTYTKDQILELYLNRVYFGSGAYGVEAAAQKYFGKSARSVTIAESAMLGGLVQAPSRLSPHRNPDAAEKRAQLVLAAMAEQGFVSESSAKTALAVPAEALERAGAGSINFAADYVMDLLDDFIGPVENDITVLTTIDLKLQTTAETALVEALNAQGAKQGVKQGAVVSMSPDGGLKVIVGGKDYGASQFNRAATAKRQPGSAFKPFVYLTAIDKGLSPDTIREDAPVTIKGWSPENASREYRGPVTLQTALANSFNTVAVKLAQEVTPKAVIRTAQKLGITSALQPNASIALGTSEVTPLELTSAYAAFANGGTGVIPYVIREVKTTGGKMVYRREGGGLGQVITPQALSMMNAMMRETLLTGTGKRADVPGWEVAGKTGTTQDFHDAWFAGYSSKLVTVVWLGNDDNSPMKRVSGSGLPAEIWGRFMKAAHVGLSPLPLPGGLWRSGPKPLFGTDAPVATLPPQGNGTRPAPPAQVNSDRAWTPPSPAEKGLLERLFGG
jgi:penicillin-binding protein 1A